MPDAVGVRPRPPQPLGFAKRIRWGTRARSQAAWNSGRLNDDPACCAMLDRDHGISKEVIHDGINPYTKW